MENAHSHRSLDAYTDRRELEEDTGDEVDASKRQQQAGGGTTAHDQSIGIFPASIKSTVDIPWDPSSGRGTFARSACDGSGDLVRVACRSCEHGKASLIVANVRVPGEQ